jgi:putative tryptophan/tyrosine transport system substrate-binding protein
MRIGKLGVAACLGAFALAGGAASAQAPAPEKTLRIAILSSGTQEVRSPFDEALVQGLREQGWVEGRNLFIDRRYGASRIVENAKELGAKNLDAILTTCSPSTRTMMDTSTTTPIIMAAVSDPVRQHLIASFARPGGNVTGTSSQAEDLLSKRLEQLKALLPNVTTVAVLSNPRNTAHTLGWQILERAAPGMRLRLVRLEINTPDEAAGAIDKAARAEAGALLVLPDDPLMLNARPQIVAAAAKHRIPDFHWERSFVESGGLLSYGEDLRDTYRTAALYFDKVKKGARPAVLPVEQPKRFELVINQRTAATLGLTVPPSMLVSADFVLK